MKYNIKISVEAANETEAQSTGILLQNIADNTDTETRYYLYKKILQFPGYFRKIADKLKNPIVQKILG